MSIKKKRGRNLILIGMPAAGKSTVGVIAAKLLGMDFVDTDLIIQRECGMRLSDIIAERGVDGFLEIENEILAGLMAENTVIATGGSAVYGREGMEHLRKHGDAVYLKTGLPVLKMRLNNIRQRGVVLRDGQTLEDLYRERSALYEAYADVVIETEGGGIEVTAEKIVEAAEALRSES